MLTPQQRLDRMKNEDGQAKKEGFDQFMSAPLVRLLLSQIPQGDHPENLQVLLQTAFEKGFEEGQGQLAMTLARAVVESHDKN